MLNQIFKMSPNEKLFFLEAGLHDSLCFCLHSPYFCKMIKYDYDGDENFCRLPNAKTQSCLLAELETSAMISLFDIGYQAIVLTTILSIANDAVTLKKVFIHITARNFMSIFVVFNYISIFFCNVTQA